MALFAAHDMRTAIYVSSYIRIIHVLYSSTRTGIQLYTCPRTNMYMWRRYKKLSRYVLLYVCPCPAICFLVLLYICIRILIYMCCYVIYMSPYYYMCAGTD